MFVMTQLASVPVEVVLLELVVTFVVMASLILVERMKMPVLVVFVMTTQNSVLQH
jgi:hypothetical protein